MPDGCKKFHHKGSSAKFLKSTCLKCGYESWAERERQSPLLDPETCPHANTDHRGSNQFVRNTWCKDCETYIESVERGIHLQIEAVKKELSKASLEETTLISRVMADVNLNKDLIVRASKRMVETLERSEDDQ